VQLGQADATLAEQPEPLDLVREAVRAIQYGSEDEAVVALRKLVSCHPQDGASDPIHEAVRQIQYGDTNEAALALKRVLGCPLNDSQINPFDGCVLDHMRNIESDFAAKSIKQACVRMAEKDLPVKNERSQIFANLGGGHIVSTILAKLRRLST
jgi:Flp pilus assembly protein TadD